MRTVFEILCEVLCVRTVYEVLYAYCLWGTVCVFSMRYYVSTASEVVCAYCLWDTVCVLSIRYCVRTICDAVCACCLWGNVRAICEAWCAHSMLVMCSYFQLRIVCVLSLKYCLRAVCERLYVKNLCAPVYEVLYAHTVLRARAHTHTLTHTHTRTHARTHARTQTSLHNIVLVDNSCCFLNKRIFPNILKIAIAYQTHRQ